MASEMYNPVSPGELLREFLGDRSVSAQADHISIARATVSRILNGRSAVTVEMSLRGAAFEPLTGFFIRAQVQYDLWKASR